MYKFSQSAPKIFLASLFGLAAHIGLCQDGYHVGEDASPAPVQADPGPVRMVRISFMVGQISWRPDENSDWSPATMNMPLRQGAQIWVSDRSRAELQFDDGSYVRLGGVRNSEGGVVSIQTLFSDSNGEFTELGLHGGLLSFKLVNPQSVYQIDTSNLSVKATGPADFRIGENTEVEVTDRAGQVNVQSSNGDSLDLQGGQSTFAATPGAPLPVSPLPSYDNWDRFVNERDSVVNGHASNVPPNIALCAGDLDSQGTWRQGQYGNVWYPTVSPGWSPYHAGHWVYASPWGWTWCSNESWGWAPYHYGTWTHSDYGWGWVPGPAQQCWSPAVVHFANDGGHVVWCPLAPSEVSYPSTRVGVWGSGWALSFSIGTVGCYYPNSEGRCEPRYFQNERVNQVTNITNVTTINNYYGNTSSSNTHFVPRNAHIAAASSSVAVGDFGRDSIPTSVGSEAVGAFQRGKSIAPDRGHPMSGPPGVQVDRSSFTPTHAFTATRPKSTLFQKVLFAPHPSTRVRNPQPPTGKPKNNPPTHP